MSQAEPDADADADDSEFLAEAPHKSPTNSHATTSSVGTNTCTCDAGRKLTAQDTDLLCELPDHPSDEVGQYEMSLDARQDGGNSEISVALDEQPDMQELGSLVRGGN